MPHFTFRTFFPIFLFLSLMLYPHSLPAAELKDVREALTDLLGPRPSGPFIVDSSGSEPFPVAPSIVDVYMQNGYQPFWVDAQGPTSKAAILKQVLATAEGDGLYSGDYHIDQLDSQWASSDPKILATVDVLLTTMMHSYVSDLSEGRIDPCLRDPDLFTCARDRFIDPLDLIARAMAAADLSLFLGSQAPDNNQYRSLKRVLAKYREIEKGGGLPMVPDGPLLRPAMSDPRVPAIRNRLMLTGDLSADTPSDSPLFYDNATVESVMAFQKKHGLKVDGIVGSETRSAMNLPAKALINTIIINMERLRWLSGGAGSLHVTVNIAGFQLAVVNVGKTIIEMPVIVGKNYRRTPVFSDTISYIEFNPYWNIPASIARRDILPKLKNTPSYLTDMGIRVFDGWLEDANLLDPDMIQWETISDHQLNRLKLRQDPGPKNLLGRVKFMFPNRFSVYLHDTPSQHLFERTIRTFSSGCIRLSNPLGLAEYLLSENSEDWNIGRIRQTVDSGIRTIVKLDTPVPIHIVYLTAYTDSDGEVFFKKDVYGRDALLEEALFGGKRDKTDERSTSNIQHSTSN